MSQKQNHAMRATLSVTAIVFISKAVGFVRDAVQYNYFGTTAQSDAYTNAYGLYYIPILLLTSCISSTMIPLYLDADRQGGKALANRFASHCVSLFALVAALLAVLMYALAGPLVQLIYPKLAPENIALTAELTRIMMPSLIFVTISIVQATIMNARERFIAGQLSGFPYSIVTILAAVLFSARYGIRAQAWATALAGLLQMLVVLPFQRGIFRYEPSLDLRDARIKRMMMLAVPSMLSMAVNEVIHQIDRSYASGLNVGDATAMSAAFRLITFIVGVVSVPLVTVMFSRMSGRAAQKDHSGVADILMQCVEVIAMVLLPLTALGVIFNLDVIKFAYMRGEFNLASAQNTAGIFAMYLLGVVFFALRDLFNRGFHALQNTRVPLYTSLLTMLINVALMPLFSRLLGAAGLALAATVASVAGVVVLFFRLKRRLGKMDLRRTGLELFKMLFATAICAALGMELNRLVPDAHGTLQVLMRLLLCGVPCLLAYAVALIVMRVRQLDFFKSILKR